MSVVVWDVKWCPNSRITPPPPPPPSTQENVSLDFEEEESPEVPQGTFRIA